MSRAESVERGVASRLLLLVRRRQRRDEERSFRWRMTNAAMFGLAVPEKIDRRAWWWRVDEAELIQRACFGLRGVRPRFVDDRTIRYFGGIR